MIGTLGLLDQGFWEESDMAQACAAWGGIPAEGGARWKKGGLGFNGERRGQQIMNLLVRVPYSPQPDES